MELEQLFCEIDDFCHGFEAVFKSKLISEQPRKRLLLTATPVVLLRMG